MNYLGIGIFIFLTIIIIVIAILVTIAIDQLIRLIAPTDPVQNQILNTVTSLGSFIIIFLIFLIALGLIGAILAYYYSNGTGVLTGTDWTFYVGLILTLFTIGLLLLELYAYRELGLYRPSSDQVKVVDLAKSYLLWSIILTVVVLIFSFISLFLI
jgi:hypothetical protein